MSNSPVNIVEKRVMKGMDEGKSKRNHESRTESALLKEREEEECQQLEAETKEIAAEHSRLSKKLKRLSAECCTLQEQNNTLQEEIEFLEKQKERVEMHGKVLHILPNRKEESHRRAEYKTANMQE